MTDLFNYERGIRLNDSNIWLDVTRIVDLAVVSHGHADHIRRHRWAVCTPATLDFMRLRLGKIPGQALEYGHPLNLDGFTISLLPSGHILGAAQILVERDGHRLLYSGDFSMEAGRTTQPIHFARCESLIVETTFGHPRYRLPPRSLAEEQTVEAARRAIREGVTPVFLAYALGKSQEVAKLLGGEGITVAVHHSIMKSIRIYEKHGIRFENCEVLHRGEVEGKAVIVPPTARRYRWIQAMRPKRLIMVTGWAAEPSFKFKARVDEAIPLSDHADYDGILEYVERTGARRVYTTHGFEDFYHALRERGVDAHSLKPQAQMSLI